MRNGAAKSGNLIHQRTARLATVSHLVRILDVLWIQSHFAGDFLYVHMNHRAAGKWHDVSWQISSGEYVVKFSRREEEAQ